MVRLLTVEVSARGEFSISKKLAASFVEHWKANHPGGEVVARDLNTTDLPFLDLNWILGVFGAPEHRSATTDAALAVSDELIAELKDADHILISTPMYNFSIPAILKAYIDHVVRAGVTFDANYQGLVKGKLATVIVTAASDFSPATGRPGLDHATGYLRQILGFIGITDLSVILADGAMAVSRGELTHEEFGSRFADLLIAAAGSNATVERQVDAAE
ncbi:FMN-dependent NADH-azoreductase [Ensifer adhaerens]|uniref:FMN-dependent NADH-azoreductase n=1 Tax=Ensifer adhaerens TaxID=106592 RepID=UPI000DC57B98|nr:NAD(P)H-dependent oxidoreductase [Ensifer adhaerens]RAR98753.1 FMN-dependent NADH-azoreductase [Ensifer adhaerens]